jgi:hypothetical protein
MALAGSVRVKQHHDLTISHLTDTNMPESRGRKRKKLAVVAAQVARSEAAPPAQSRRGVGRVARALITLFTILAGAVGLTVVWPRVTVEPTDVSEASNPFSGIFKVANLQNYPLHDVRIEAFPWCTKIGRGTDTTPPTRCERGMPSSKREWNHRTIAADDSYQVEVGNVLFATPAALLYADISIKVTFEPWFTPYHLQREFRFYTRRKDDGTIEWLHRPLE